MAAIPKPIRIIDAPRRIFAREQGCIIAKYHQCDGRIEAHHVIEKGQGRVGSKVSDRKTVGLCQAAHKLANRRDLFEQTFPVILKEEYERLNREFDALPKPRKLRIRKPSFSIIVSDCACSDPKPHKIPSAKLRLESGLLWYPCPRLKSFQELSLTSVSLRAVCRMTPETLDRPEVREPVEGGR